MLVNDFCRYLLSYGGQMYRENKAVFCAFLSAIRAFVLGNCSHECTNEERICIHSPETIQKTVLRGKSGFNKFDT